MAEHAAAAGIGLIDMGKGAKRYKETLKTRDLLVSEGTAARRTPLALAHRTFTTPALWAARNVRKNPRLFHVADHLLRRYGRAATTLRPPPPAPHVLSGSDLLRSRQ
jgi:hypothetical protein